MADRTTTVAYCTYTRNQKLFCIMCQLCLYRVSEKWRICWTNMLVQIYCAKSTKTTVLTSGNMHTAYCFTPILSRLIASDDRQFYRRTFYTSVLACSLFSWMLTCDTTDGCHVLSQLNLWHEYRLKECKVHTAEAHSWLNVDIRLRFLNSYRSYKIAQKHDQPCTVMIRNM